VPAETKDHHRSAGPGKYQPRRRSSSRSCAAVGPVLGWLEASRQRAGQGLVCASLISPWRAPGAVVSTARVFLRPFPLRAIPSRNSGNARLLTEAPKFNLKLAVEGEAGIGSTAPVAPVGQDAHVVDLSHPGGDQAQDRHQCGIRYRCSSPVLGALVHSSLRFLH
jgi:hypothetical protein